MVTATVAVTTTITITTITITTITTTSFIQWVIMANKLLLPFLALTIRIVIIMIDFIIIIITIPATITRVVANFPFATIIFILGMASVNSQGIAITSRVKVDLMAISSIPFLVADLF